MSLETPHPDRMHLGDDASDRLEVLTRRVEAMIQMVRHQRDDGLLLVHADDLHAAIQELGLLRHQLAEGLHGQQDKVSVAGAVHEARNRFYTWVGGGVLVGLFIAGLLAVTGVSGPGLIPLSTAIVALGVAVACTALGVVALAFSFGALAQRIS